MYLGSVNELLAQQTIDSRFKPPKGFVRIPTGSNDFGKYLRKIPLKPPGSPVLYYNNNPIPNQNNHAAVLDISIGKKNLQQCADAVIRLKAEWLFEAKKFELISFHLTNGMEVPFTKWAQGFRIKVTGNQTKWYKRYDQENFSHNSLLSYLEFVYTYAGTLSLANESDHIAYDSLEIGAIFIQPGSPGHCVIVVDMAINTATGDKVFLLAQSYMPAQSIHILKHTQGAWFSAKNGLLNTPYWVFSINDCKRTR